MHKILWNKALVDFKWLDKKGLIQQTTFSDGSVIFANFSAQDYSFQSHSDDSEQNNTIPAKSIYAIMSNHREIVWRSNSL
jgi:hypothetical protein